MVSCILHVRSQWIAGRHTSMHRWRSQTAKAASEETPCGPGRRVLILHGFFKQLPPTPGFRVCLEPRSDGSWCVMDVDMKPNTEHRALHQMYVFCCEASYFQCVGNGIFLSHVYTSPHSSVQVLFLAARTLAPKLPLNARMHLLDFRPCANEGGVPG